jgi:wyosine [tRNA(Phe)-imidazoG37] synthetase (radical SAM superfamily)
LSAYRHLFGPVPSRRLGRSLGVDLTPFKTCSFDCIFCQLGRTTNRTLVRDEYVPIGSVLKELGEWLEQGGHADYITLAGSGEPTLNSRFGEVIDFVHAHSLIPVALLTNGTTLADPAVRSAAAKADLVKVSLSAWNTASLERVNRPCQGITLKGLVEGQWQFRHEFHGQLWLEAFLLLGINSLPHEASHIAELVKVIGPDRVQLNTAVRPPAEAYVHPLPGEELAELARLFDPPAEVIAEFSPNGSADIRATEEMVLSMLRRRPCTATQIADVFGLHANEVAKYVGKLLRTNRIRAEKRAGIMYYARLAPESAESKWHVPKDTIGHDEQPDGANA